MIYVDRLSLPSVEDMSAEAREQNIQEVGHLAQKARIEIGSLANAVSREFSALLDLSISFLSFLAVFQLETQPTVW